MKRFLNALLVLIVVSVCCGKQSASGNKTPSVEIAGGWSFVVMGDSRPAAWDS